MDIREPKAHLRVAIKERLSHLSNKDRHAESRSLCRRVLEALPEGPLTIAAYFPLKDEADVRMLLQEFLARGDKVFLPRIENQKIVFRQMLSLTGLTDGMFGIPEPAEDDPPLDSATLDIALIPGRAFDARGNRLGRGNGGYDIWMRKQRAMNPKTQFWGLALECQLVPEMPMEEHDERVDAVITARGMTNS